MTRHLTRTDVAVHYGITAASVSKAVERGSLPPPDYHVGRTPIWMPETLDAWTRPGRGAGGGRPRKTTRKDTP